MGWRGGILKNEGAGRAGKEIIRGRSQDSGVARSRTFRKWSVTQFGDILISYGP